MSYTQQPLPYAYDALEPYVDAKTMEVHYTKHHAAYVANLNAALEKYHDWAAKPIEEIVRQVMQIPEDVRMAVRNHGGGHFNHSLFWEVMKPGGGGEPTGELLAAVNKEFGSFAQFKEKFSEAGMKRFGSGWAWLSVKPDGSLCVCSSPNQDNPMMEGVAECSGKPVMGLDVWEHAYYLKYQNRRNEYVEAWWNVVNWEKVAENLKKARG
ncbi:MAG TPA: superoxide dismutase [bacterium]|nr:superoxide dismutase [bacterium]